MPINDTYTNLPGYVAQIFDNGLQVPPPQQTLATSVLLFGTATDGPVNTPINIQSIAGAETLFGVTSRATSITGAPGFAKALTRGIYEAFQAGCSNITLVRVGGTTASLTLTDAGTGSNGVVLTGNYPGYQYNGLTASVVAAGTGTGTVTITTLDSIAHTFSFTAATLYGDLLNSINAANLNIQASQLSATGSPYADVNLSTVGTTAFSGGTDGTNMSDTAYSTALNTAYAIMENFGADIVVPLGAYLQPAFTLNGSNQPVVPNTNNGDTVFFGQNLAQFCARSSVRTQSCFGVIATATLPVPTYTNATNWANQLMATTPTASGGYTFQYAGAYSAPGGSVSAPVLGSNGKFVNTGYLLNIVVGPDIIVNNPQIGNYQIDGAAAYAGLCCSLAPQSSTTNKPMNSVIALAFNYGAAIQNTLVGNNFVVLNSVNGAVRPVADQTYASITPTVSDFTHLSTLRITYAAMEGVRQVTQSFIGEAANPANLNAMGTAVDGALKAMQKAGALISYQYTINASAADQIAGNLRIALVLVPALEIRKIYVTITLQPGAAF